MSGQKAAETFAGGRAAGAWWRRPTLDGRPRRASCGSGCAAAANRALAQPSRISSGRQDSKVARRLGRVLHETQQSQTHGHVGSREGLDPTYAAHDLPYGAGERTEVAIATEKTWTGRGPMA